MTNSRPVTTIGILVFDDVEELDFVGPLEVFGSAALEGAPCVVLTVAERETMVRGRHGLRVLPDVMVEVCPPLSVLVVPGGAGARSALARTEVLDFVRAQPGLVVSVCTGALVLAAAGLLDERRATTHHSALDLLRERTSVIVDPAARFVLEDRVGTSAGVTAGIDLSLAIVERLWSIEMARRVAARIEWPHRSNECGGRSLDPTP